MLLSADEYRRLKKRDREVLDVSELSGEDIEAIRTAEIPAEAAAFDHELATPIYDGISGTRVGRKASRIAPVVVLAVRQQVGERIVTVAPITHTPSRDAEDTIELPAATKRRLGLDNERSWIVATELTRFLWPGPDLRPVPGRPGAFAYGALPRELMLQFRERIAELHRDRRFRWVHRDRDESEHERR